MRKSLHKKKLNQINQYIEEHLQDEHFNVHQLSILLNISQRQLYRNIKALTQMTPHQYINQIRFQKAYEYLQHKTYPTITDTAHAVGFKDAEYFSRQFKKYFGQLPSEV